jgi:hypothetical protein
VTIPEPPDAFTSVCSLPDTAGKRLAILASVMLRLE